jgi:hypothetical protein
MQNWTAIYSLAYVSLAGGSPGLACRVNRVGDHIG